MLVLGIESTCDETAASVVKDGKEILSNVISSQVDLHSVYGGVVPEIACRRHVDVIIPVIQEALLKADVSLKDIDLLAVAHGPGLIGALLIGLNTAKALSLALNIPFIGVNHTEAHLYGAMMSRPSMVKFPCLGVIISGGHTTLLHIKEVGQYTLVGHTVDDAVGEAFDKTAKMIGLPYPGGPEIEKLALKGDKDRFHFKPGQVKGAPYHFSFSGIKTAVLYTIKDLVALQGELKDNDKLDIAASFQQAACSDIVKKTLKAAKDYACNTIVVGGGVSCNRYLRGLFEKQAKGFDVIWPAKDLSLDNAAMIAGLGWYYYTKKGVGDPLSLKPLTRMPYES